MATLIPAIGACVSRMTTGERRLAERLEAKLDDDYRLWYDVPMGPRNTHPDFCVLHPRRGLLMLEVKDWNSKTTILKIDYRNTRQILHTASLVAAEHLSPHAPPLRGSLPPKGLIRHGAALRRIGC